MRPILGVLEAGFLRDWRIGRSYRLAFVLRFLGTAFQVVVFYFIGRLLGEGHPALAPYGGDYFAYVLIGLAFQRLFNLSLAGYGAGIGEAQQTGTFEAQLLWPVSWPWLVVSFNLWPYTYALAETALYLVLGVLLGAPLTGANWVGAFGVALLACVAISGLGLMGAGLIIVAKRGNVVAWAVEAATALLAGVYFPTALLPDPLPRLAFMLPQTYALRGLRDALLLGQNTMALAPELLVLLAYAFVLVPLGVLTLHLACRWAQAQGSLAQY
jgi:ABC-2 type transport system permease protein